MRKVCGFFMLPLAVVLCGCGGGNAAPGAGQSQIPGSVQVPGAGNGSVSTDRTALAGVYQANITRASPGNSIVVLALLPDGTGDFVYMDITGSSYICKIEGRYDTGESLTWTGTDNANNPVTLSGQVTGNPPVFNGSLTGPFANNFTAIRTLADTAKLFEGTWSFAESGGQGATFTWVITGKTVAVTGTRKGLLGHLPDGTPYQPTLKLDYSGSIDPSGLFILGGTKTDVTEGAGIVHAPPITVKPTQGVLVLGTDPRTAKVYSTFDPDSAGLFNPLSGSH